MRTYTGFHTKFDQQANINSYRQMNPKYIHIEVNLSH